MSEQHNPSAENEAELERLRAFLRVSRLMNAETNRARLIQEINEEVRDYLEADRFTVFFHDPENDELYSYIASGLEHGEIRIPSDQGIAGAVYQTGDSLRLVDAYEDDRFDPDVDRKTGYHTRSLLSYPIVNRKGVRIGVVQALNKTTGDSTFNDEDERFVRELVEQISDTLDLLLRKEVLARQHEVMHEALQHLKVYDYLIGEKTITKQAMRWSRKLHIWVSAVGAIGLAIMAITGLLIPHLDYPLKNTMLDVHSGKIVLGGSYFIYSDLVGIAMAIVTLTGIMLWIYPILVKYLRARLEEKGIGK